jgi:hypothetical protein
VACGTKCLRVESVAYRKVRTSLYIDIKVQPVQAVVRVLLRLNGVDFGVGSGTTGSRTKVVTFVIPNAPSGVYTSEIRSVTRAGYLWDGIQANNLRCIGSKKVCK